MEKEGQTSSGNKPGAPLTGWPLSRPAHALSPEEAVRELSCDGMNGLSKTEASSRLERCGRNELGQAPGVQPVKIFIRQIANAMTMVLIMAMAVSFGIQSWIEGGVIAAVVVLNIVVGFIQEYSAEKTMDSLRSLSSPTANAIRGGEPVVVPTAEVVPGDLMELKAGDTIPADIRLIEAVNFETDEALLTGESLPVRKDAEAVFSNETGPGDRLNVAYSSSTVTKGRGKGVVYATGMSTEIGTIAAALQAKAPNTRQVKRKEDGTAGPYRYVEAWTLTGTDAVGRFLGLNIGTPLQKKLSRLAILLFFIALVCALLVFAANKFRVSQDIIIYAVATGLSMIPSSLVVILTITMAYGTKTMVERHVIVRNLRSLEALGAVTDICSDKTGTLTQGRMVTKQVWIPGRGTYSIGTSKNPFDPTVGDLEFNSLPPSMINSSEIPFNPVGYVDQIKYDPVLKFLKVACLANLATVHQTDDGQWGARGDPTEIALQVFSCRFGWSRAELTAAAKGSATPAWKEVAEFPFDSDVKKMSVIVKDVKSDTLNVFTKGAVERVITSCVAIFRSSGLVPMTSEIQDEIIENMEALAAQGLRVLALASRTYSSPIVEGEEINRATVESDLNFCGLVGIYDPPRVESMGSVGECHDAGISVHMLTGDHPGTARAIAAEVGILPTRTNNLSKQSNDSMVMTAAEFDKLSDAQVDELPILPLVIARCAPNTKVRMIEALHRRKKFCAMTGDGVNDSPSLKRADVGIAMGQAGSDVAKEASDIILTDDNFASITNAIKEGRRMFDNIQKYVLHVLAENIAQAGTLLIGLVFKDQTGTSVFALSPVQILWVIVATSGMPDMGLGFERAQPNIMVRPPQSLKTGIFTREVMLDMIVYGTWVTTLCLSSFALVTYGFGDGDLGENCNNNYTNSAGEPVCDLVFRARATTFACLTWFALFLAWEMVDLRRSFFRLKPGKQSNILTGWMHDVWQNQFLFWAIIAGFVTIFPTMYIPVINHSVFKHTGITWEWGIVAVETVLFFAGVETWKFGKRMYFERRKTNGVIVGIGNSDDDLEAK